MPTKTYRFYDPSHQASFQQTLQSSDRTVYHSKGQKQTTPWAQSSARKEFEDAQRGNDMAHIISHKQWIQYDLTGTVPSTSSTEARTAGTSFVRPINLYIRSSESAAGNGNAWLHCGAALLTLQYPNAANRSSNQGWVTLHSHGSGRIAGVFSVFFGMQVVRFNDSVLCTTIQTQANGPRFVTYSFQCETVEQASELRHALASAASAALPTTGHALAISPEVIEGNIERRLSSWINAIEGQHFAPLEPSLSFGHDGASVSNHSEMAVQPPTTFGRRRRGGVDLGDAYWDFEKSRALQEAKTELDSLQLKRLLSGFEL